MADPNASSTTTASTVSATTDTTHGNTTLRAPNGAISKLDGAQSWPEWSNAVAALFRVYGHRDHITEDPPSPPDQAKWLKDDDKLCGSLELYINRDVLSQIPDSKFKTVKAKWNELKRLYGGMASMVTFNLWRELANFRLDESTDFSTQLHRINDTRVTLAEKDWEIPEKQFCFILLDAAPESYAPVVGTILANATPKDLASHVIQERLLNEEQRRKGTNASLNKVVPVKKGGKGDKKVKCYYCKKPGHKSPECRTKQRDEAKGKDSDKDKESKDKDKGKAVDKSQKSVNSVVTSAYITEVCDTDSDSEYQIKVSSYATAQPRWMVDSGATHHITPHRSDFATYKPARGNVNWGEQVITPQIGVGTVILHPADGNRSIEITLHDVMHVPDAKGRFFSLDAAAERGADIRFTRQGPLLISNGKVVLKGFRENRLHWFHTSNPAVHSFRASQPSDIWHQRMGHMSYKALAQHSKAVSGLTLDPDSEREHPPCHGCELGKQTRLPFHASAKRSDQILQIVHSDLAGPMQVRSLRGALYIATFIDDHSRFGVVYFLKSKDQCAAAFKKYLAWAETQTSKKLLCLHSDRGGEYLSQAVRSLLDEKGIEHKLTMPGSPQQNGLAERWNRTILDKARSMLHGASLSLSFWELATDVAVHIHNRTPSRVIGWHTPHELWTSRVPDVSYFRVFGCLAYAHVPQGKRQKLDPRSVPMTFVGYEPGSKGYRLWNSTTRTIVLSRDVTFDERSYPAKASGPPSALPALPTIHEVPELMGFPTSDERTYEPPPQPEQRVQPPAQPDPTIHAPIDPQTPDNRPLPTRESTIYHTPPSQPPAPSIQHERTPPSAPAPAPRAPRPARIVRLPGPSFGPPQGLPRLRPNPRPSSRAQGNAVERIERCDSDSISHHALISAAIYAAEYRDPLTFKEAMSSDLADEWQGACQYEIDALAKNGTWILVDLPAGRKPVKSKWVFKRKADGRLRARLVAKGFTQVQGIDYDETFSPVARFESLRLLLALAALEDWEIHQMDVKSAFLNGLLDEEIYMEQPQGFVAPGQSDKVCLLKKAIYGLKQASRAWNLQFNQVLLDLGFKRTHSDAGIYHRLDAGGTIIIILYVDDITILGDTITQMTSLKATLSARYEMTDLGEIDSYLGVKITRDRSIKRLDIDQSRYVLEIISRFGLADANATRTPLPAGAEAHLVKHTGEATPREIKYYQQIIGSLLYVQIGTRPDISFAVSRLAQYASNPSSQHLRLAKYVLSYLKGNADYKLRYDGAGGDGLFGYSDSSYGDQTDDFHSTSGYVFLLADAAISWSSRKQKTVAQSTTHAEYMALADAANQAAWYRSFFTEINYDFRDPIPLHGDNKGSIDLALNPATGKRSKHIPIKFHVIREYVEEGLIDLIRTPTLDMLADGLTKPHPHARLSEFVHGLGLT
jgi:transposase InsO family protein